MLMGLCINIVVAAHIFKSNQRLRSQQLNIFPGQQAVHFTGKRLIKEGFQRAADGGYLAGIDAGINPHLRKHPHQVFGGDIAGGAFDKRAAAHAAKGCIEMIDPQR